MTGNTLIIAEAGVNHNGSLALAKRMAEVAKECGADIIKYQTAKLDSLVSENAGMADYQKQNTGFDKSQKEMLKDLLLPFDAFRELADHCAILGIQFLSTPFDIESIKLLNDLQEMWKIPSGEITDYPYLSEIAKHPKKTILSTGMSTLDEVRQAVDVLTGNSIKDITLLHCTTDYPADINDINLNAMITLKNEFDLPVGYSDHTNGIEISIAAVAMGASIIEKHFTLDRSMSGPDHKASLEPNELKQLITSIRTIEAAMGCFEKKPTAAEIRNRNVARKSIVAAKEIKKGEMFSDVNLTTKRPGTGLSPMLWNDLIGRYSTRDYKKDDLIEL